MTQNKNETSLALTGKLARPNGMIGHAEEGYWLAPHDMTREEWEYQGRAFQAINKNIVWWIGDWLNEGEKRYGETYTQAVEYTGRDVEQLRQWKWVTGAIERERRRVKELAFTYHRLVAKLPPEEQDYWLQRCIDEGWDSETLAAKLRADSGEPKVIPARLTKKATPEEAMEWLRATFDDDWWSEFSYLLT